MLSARLRYRLRDLRRLRREGSLLTVKQLETLMNLYPLRPVRPQDGSQWTQRQTTDDSSCSSEETESPPTPSGEIHVESTDRMDAGWRGEDGLSPTLGAGQ